MTEPIAKLKYEYGHYHDDTGVVWYVTLRRRNLYMGNFHMTPPLDYDPVRVHAFPFQNGRMRYITVKMQNGKTLRFPQAKLDSPLYHSIGQLVSIPIWDDLNDDGTGGSEWQFGTVVGRRGERLREGDYLENEADSFPA